MPLKGQVLSEESIQKMKESKRNTLMKKYDWSFAESYLDVELKLSSRGRKRSYITLRQFKQMLEDGMGIREFQKETSKSLVGFFSAFCQGKITLDKQSFIKEYEKGKPLIKIAEENNISKDYIGFLRQLYEYKAKGPTFIHRKATEVPLTQRQREIIYGSMMGDAKKEAPASIGFVHGPKQRLYLEWKYKELKSLATKNGIKEYPSYNKKTGNLSFSYRFYTYSNTELEEINKKFYITKNYKDKKEKEVSADILSRLTPLSIAVWYSDDGNTAMSYSSKVKYGYNIKCTFSFCTDSFSFQSCENIKKWFLDKYNIKTRIKYKGLRKDGITPKYRIIVEHESNDDFVNLIRPHLLPMFMYKIDYDAYLAWRRKG